MQLELERKKLEYCISANTIAVGSGTDIFSHFIFRFSEGLLEIASSNGRAGILSKLSIPKDTDIPEEMFAVEAWRVREWSSACTSEFISLSYEDSTLTFSDDFGKIQLPCASASLFPMWEKTFEKSKDTEYRISSKFLKEAFQWVKGFIAEDVESERPEISVAESRGGTLAATNGLVLASVNSPIFEKLKLRIHGKDFSTLQKYMSFCKGEPVTVYHCEDAMFFEKEDGTLYFLQKPPTPMEEYTFDDENHFEVSFDKKDFMSAVKSLSAAIDRDKKTLCISFPEENVLSISDGTKKNTMKITCALESFTESHEDFLKTGFHFNYPYLMKMLALSSEDLQKMGIVIKERNDQIVGGMLNLKEKRDSKEGGIVEYTADMVWRIL